VTPSLRPSTDAELGVDASEVGFNGLDGHEERRGDLAVGTPDGRQLCDLFWTGARPSEASGLQWGDVDFKGKLVFVRRSFHLGAYAGAKTKRSVRRVQLADDLVELLRALQPLRVEPTTPVFTKLDGTAIEPKTFSNH
jgi:integrase